MTLTIQDLGALGELLGSLAVLATLIYLALQTRQNTMAISAQLDAATMLARQEGLLLMSTSKELAEALNQQRVHPQPIELDRVNAFWTAQMIRWQWMFPTLAPRPPSVHQPGGPPSTDRPAVRRVPRLPGLVGGHELEPQP